MFILTWALGAKETGGTLPALPWCLAMAVSAEYVCSKLVLVIRDFPLVTTSRKPNLNFWEECANVAFPVRRAQKWPSFFFFFTSVSVSEQTLPHPTPKPMQNS